MTFGIIQTDMNTNTCVFYTVNASTVAVSIRCLTTMVTAKKGGAEYKGKKPMTNKLKCPFCGEKLVRYWGMESPAIYCCDNQKCSRGGIATESAWQALIESHKSIVLSEQSADREIHRLRDLLSQSQKDLGIATKALEDIASGQIIEHSVCGHESDNKIFIARKALEQINQKENQ